MKKCFLYIILIFLISINLAYSAEEKLIILDSSLSMNQPINGVPKYSLAVEAAKMQLQKLDQGELVGLRTIGLPIDSALIAFLSNPSELCRATQLVAPIRSYNFSNIESALNSVMPLGTTPLTYSLDTAIQNDFMTGSHTKHIILITDGGESCHENPCEYIKKLMSKRSDIKIDVIAIGVNGAEFAQLKCLTDNTSGSIILANTSRQIEDAFGQLLIPSETNVHTAPYIPKPSYNTRQKSSGITYKNFIFETYK